MAVTFDRYTGYYARLGGLSLPDVSGLDLSPNSQKSVIWPSGSLTPKSILLSGAAPMVNITTRDLSSLLASMSLATALRVDSGSGPTALFQFQKRDPLGDFVAAGTSAHYTVTSAKGVALITNLSASQDDPSGARAQIAYYALSADGRTMPLIPAIAALVSSPAAAIQYYLGPVWTGVPGSGGAAELPGVQSVSITPGIAYSAKAASGNVFATSGSVVAIAPEVRISTTDLGATLNLLGARLFGRSLVCAPDRRVQIYFQQGAECSTDGNARIPTTTASHLSIAFATGDATPDGISVQGAEDAQQTIVFRPTQALVATSNVQIP